MRRIAIFSVGDSRYVPVEFVALSSIKRFNPAYDYIVFVPAGSPDTAAWRTHASRLGIQIMEVDFGAYFRTRKLHSVWPLECLMWFIVPSLLSGMGYSHSLYVDGDILCLKSLDFTELLDRQESIIGIDNGPALRQLAHVDCIEQLLGKKLATANTATNTGVLFFRNADLAESHFATRVAELYEQCWPWGLSELSDQSLLALYVAVHDIKIGVADPSWNLRLYPDSYGHNYRLLRGYYGRTHTPNIIHFLGGKPWTDPPTARSLYRHYVKGMGQEQWNSAARTRRDAANRWRELAVDTLGTEYAVRVFGTRVLHPVKTCLAGAVHGYLFEQVLSHRAKKAMRDNEGH